jgi:hypothetical protein
LFRKKRVQTIKMNYFKKIFNNCHEVSMLSIKGKEEHLSFKTKVEMALHIAFCKCCQNFIKQSDKMDTAFNAMSKNLENQSPYKISEAFKEELKNKLNNL